MKKIKILLASSMLVLLSACSHMLGSYDEKEARSQTRLVLGYSLKEAANIEILNFKSEQAIGQMSWDAIIDDANYSCSYNYYKGTMVEGSFIYTDCDKN